MKNIVRFSRLAAIAIAAVALACPAAAQADENEGLTIQQQIDQPEISNKASAPLIRHFERMGNTFGEHGLKISYERRGQILCVTVPASELFAPNDTKLRKRASKYLMAFRELVKLPQMYRILVVVHSDGTGSPEYSDALTADRADSIIDFFERITSDDGLNLVRQPCRQPPRRLLHHPPARPNRPGPLRPPVKAAHPYKQTHQQRPPRTGAAFVTHIVRMAFPV